MSANVAEPEQHCNESTATHGSVTVPTARHLAHLLSRLRPSELTGKKKAVLLAKNKIAATYWRIFRYADIG